MSTPDNREENLVVSPALWAIEDLLTIPIIFTPDDETNWQQIVAHGNRVLATREFVEGRMSVEEYEDILSDNGVDVRVAEEYWEEGICLH